MENVNTPEFECSSVVSTTNVVVSNIGKLVSGDWNEGVLKEDTILIKDGKTAEVGFKDEINEKKADLVIDANGMTVTPGFIDPHTHLPIGDYAPMQRMFGVMEESLLQGITTIINEWEQFEGLPLFYPPDPLGVKATAILAYKAYRNFRPGGAQKIPRRRDNAGEGLEGGRL